MCVDLESEMGTSVVHIKHKLKSLEATERSYVQCGTVQAVEIIEILLEELESAHH
jgi:hypothetical protein